MKHPEVARIEQIFDRTRVTDIAETIRGELTAMHLGSMVRPGDRVAITAGSRGIANIALVLKTVVAELKSCGAEPFIFPAMGSHGGATAEGQLKVLEGLGITESRCGCPIESTMEVVHLGDADAGYPIYIDRLASEADHIVVVNRVKAHTKFSGPIESGLMKMMAIGMGKHKGAEFYHKAAVQLTFRNIVTTVGQEIIRRLPILFGLGIVENAYHQIAEIRACTSDNICEGERELLIYAKKIMARLPFNDIDVLIIDRIGKDISGTGMDTNVTGRNRDILDDFQSDMRIKRIFVRDLTDATAGNALGVGFADFVSARLVKKMNRKKTYVNCLTAISPEKGAIPIWFDRDEDALSACYNTIGSIPIEEIRLVHIKDTLSLSNLVVSRAFEQEIEAAPLLKKITPWQPLPVAGDGNMESWFEAPSDNLV